MSFWHVGLSAAEQLFPSDWLRAYVKEAVQAGVIVDPSKMHCSNKMCQNQLGHEGRCRMRHGYTGTAHT